MTFLSDLVIVDNIIGIFNCSSNRFYIFVKRKVVGVNYIIRVIVEGEVLVVIFEVIIKNEERHTPIGRVSESLVIVNNGFKKFVTGRKDDLGIAVLKSEIPRFIISPSWKKEKSRNFVGDKRVDSIFHDIFGIRGVGPNELSFKNVGIANLKEVSIGFTAVNIFGDISGNNTVLGRSETVDRRERDIKFFGDDFYKVCIKFP